MPIPTSIQSSVIGLHNAINAKDFLTAQMMARNSVSFAAEIRDFADLTPEADYALEVVVGGIRAVAVAMRHFKGDGRQGETVIESVRQAALDDHARLCRLLDMAEPSEKARILGIG